MPKVSIILPTYNGSKWISNAIESVICQSFDDWELLVIDDGSSDDTEVIIKAFLQKDSRIVYVKNNKNLGLQKTLNKGINLSKGKYIARIDDDDRWSDDDKLKKQVEFLDINPEYVLIGTGVAVVDDFNKEILRYLNPETDEMIRNVILKRNPFVHSSVVFRKDAGIKAGLYNEGDYGKYIEDYEFWLRLGREGKMYNLPIYAVRFMSRTGNTTNKNRGLQFFKAIRLIKDNRKYYRGYLKSLCFAYFRFFSFKIFNLLPKKIKHIIFRVYKAI